MRFSARCVAAMHYALLASIVPAVGFAAEAPARNEPPAAGPAAPGGPAKPDNRTPVPMTLEAFRAFVGRYQREDMIVRVFSAGGHFYLRVDDGEPAELFPLSDHEFFLKQSPDKLSFERDDRGWVTHFIRHSTAPQLFRRL